jgi:hypothetical protein
MKSKPKPKQPGRGSAGPPKTGVAGPGETVDPTRIAEDASPAETDRVGKRSMPAPGVPVSDDAYELLKKRAGTVRLPRSKHSQEDPSRKK